MNMTRHKFSIIVTTNRNIKSLEPLFRNADENSELIISDSEYNEKTKHFLEKKIGIYEQIVYVPVKKFAFGYTKDCILGMNTAFMYAENYWLFRADDNLEFKEDCFEKAREDIDYFKSSFGNEKFSIIGQKLWGSMKEERWNDCSKTKIRYSEVNNPDTTFSFGVLPIELVYDLNGYDEIYDYGWSCEENDFILRGFVAGYKFYYDREIMGYSEEHQSHTQSQHLNRFIYELLLPHIVHGKIRAYNAYDIRNLQNKYLVNKDKFIIK